MSIHVRGNRYALLGCDASWDPRVWNEVVERRSDSEYKSGLRCSGKEEVQVASLSCMRWSSGVRFSKIEIVDSGGLDCG